MMGISGKGGCWQWLWQGLVLAVALLVSLPAAADVLVTPKHLVILRPGLDSVFGSYVFAVRNTGTEPATLKTQVMLPKETSDFVPQEGLEPNDLSLSDQGVVVEKSFPSGLHVVSIGFKVDARYGRTELTLAPASDVQSFTLLVPRETGMTIASPALVSGEGAGEVDPQYQAFVSAQPLAVGRSFGISVAGLPEGRTRLWIVGAVVAGLLVLLAGFLALKTRPKIAEDDTGGTVVVG